MEAPRCRGLGSAAFQRAGEFGCGSAQGNAPAEGSGNMRRGRRQLRERQRAASRWSSSARMLAVRSSGTGAGLYSHSFLGESHNGPGPISLDIGLGNLPSVEGSESVVGGAGGGFSAGDDDDMTAGLSVNFSSLLFDD